ncbi:smoothelin-like protein 2 [Discoglossus pictus]
MDPVVDVSVWPRSLPQEDVSALRGAVEELHTEMSGFRRGVERQLEDVLRLAGPLSRTVTDLQCENRRLREQVDKLSRQVEALSRAAGLGGESPARYSSHALLAVSVKAQSTVPEAPNHVEDGTTVVENGHQTLSDKLNISQDTSSPPKVAATQEHSPALAVRMPHLPVTAVTKSIGEALPSSPNGTSRPHIHDPKSPTEVSPKQNNTPGGVRTWNASFGKTMGVSTTSEKNITTSKTSQSYSMTSSSISSESTDRYFDVTPKSKSPPPVINRQVEKKRELVRSQTLPRSSGTQARKAFFEKFDPEGAKGKGESKVKLKRSQSFGVSSASSIKQVLLEWCRSKTIGYKHIDLQNFSSSWSDGMAFCALVHSFFPEAFDYDALEPTNHKLNFETAFSAAENMAHCDRLIEVEDMLMMGRKPDPMCVFTYVQSLYNHLRRFE